MIPIVQRVGLALGLVWTGAENLVRCGSNRRCRDIKRSPSGSRCCLLHSEAFCPSLLDFSNSCVHCLPGGNVKGTMCVLLKKRLVGNFTVIKTVV